MVLAAGPAAIVSRVEARPVAWTEDLGARDDDAVSAYLAAVSASSIYLGRSSTASGLTWAGGLCFNA
jgi:hypothetical protein